jgi:hypothetical protein
MLVLASAHSVQDFFVRQQIYGNETLEMIQNCTHACKQQHAGFLLVELTLATANAAPFCQSLTMEPFHLGSLVFEHACLCASANAFTWALFAAEKAVASALEEQDTEFTVVDVCSVYSSLPSLPSLPAKNSVSLHIEKRSYSARECFSRFYVVARIIDIS